MTVMYGLRSNRFPSDRMDSFHLTYEDADEARRERVLHTSEWGDLVGAEWLDIVAVERESKPCSICGEEVQSDNPETDFCRTCFYTGRAAERSREDQIDSFRSQLPGADIAVEHTGGGCFWLAFRWEGDPKYYVATNGEASLPSVKVTDPETGKERWEDIVTGGWGYVGRHDDTEPEDWDTFDETKSDYYGHPLRWAGPTSPGTKYDAEAPEWVAYNAAVEAHWQAYPANTLSDDDVVAAIEIDRANRNQFSGS